LRAAVLRGLVFRAVVLRAVVFLVPDERLLDFGASGIPNLLGGSSLLCGKRIP
jgi:hypothetical protein